MEHERKPSRWGSPITWLVASLVISTSIWPFVYALDDEPKNFDYTHLWTSQDGETHLKQCKMQNFTLQPYSALGLPQYVKSDFGGLPTKMTFTEMPVGLVNPLHSPPSVQFVVTLMGRWYIITTDGSNYTFCPGEVLFQDNTVESPADKVPQHISATAGNVPCQQYVVQFNRTPEVDHPCPL